MKEGFTASDVQVLTGVNVETQRVWRRRGHIEGDRGAGWTRYNYADVVAVACVAELTRAGISPSHAANIVNDNQVRVQVMADQLTGTERPVSKDRLIVIAPVTIDGIGRSYDYVLCQLDELHRVFIDTESGGYLPGTPCTVVLNVSDICRRINARLNEVE